MENELLDLLNKLVKILDNNEDSFVNHTMQNDKFVMEQLNRFNKFHDDLKGPLYARATKVKNKYLYDDFMSLVKPKLRGPLEKLIKLSPDEKDITWVDILYHILNANRKMILERFIDLIGIHPRLNVSGKEAMFLLTLSVESLKNILYFTPLLEFFAKTGASIDPGHIFIYLDTLVRTIYRELNNPESDGIREVLYGFDKDLFPFYLFDPKPTVKSHRKDAIRGLLISLNFFEDEDIGIMRWLSSMSLLDFGKKSDTLLILQMNIPRLYREKTEEELDEIFFRFGINILPSRWIEEKEREYERNNLPGSKKAFYDEAIEHIRHLPFSRKMIDDIKRNISLFDPNYVKSNREKGKHVPKEHHYETNIWIDELNRNIEANRAHNLI